MSEKDKQFLRDVLKMLTGLQRLLPEVKQKIEVLLK